MLRPRRTLGRWLALGAVLALFAACGKSGEGESCVLANGNDDCDDGLVCRGSWEVASKKPVCCPRPPAKPTTSACEPKIEHFTPDPSVDAAPIPPGTGGGGNDGSAGTGGTGGSSGTGGSAGTSGDGAAGAAGSDAASGGAAGSAPDSGSD
jgi:hypothetical protein